MPESIIEKLYKKMDQYELLKHTIEMLEEQKIDKMDTKVDIGCNFYMQAQIEDTSTMIVDIGWGVFVELTREQAKSFCEQKQAQIQKKVKIYKDKIYQAKAHIKFVNEGIREIMHLEADPVKRLDSRFF